MEGGATRCQRATSNFCATAELAVQHYLEVFPVQRDRNAQRLVGDFNPVLIYPDSFR